MSRSVLAPRLLTPQTYRSSFSCGFLIVSKFPPPLLCLDSAEQTYRWGPLAYTLVTERIRANVILGDSFRPYLR